eukprot:1358849-Pyramimonas_sp.AAC.1
MTNGSIGRELILDILGGGFSYDRTMVRLSEGRGKKTVPNFRRSEFAKKKGDQYDGVGGAPH